MRNQKRIFFTYFTLLLVGLARTLCLTACSEPTTTEPTTAEPTPTVEPYHTDADVDGVCDGCGPDTMITGCSVRGSVTGSGSHTGGIAGQLYSGRIRGCANYASVVGETSTGGIVGTAAAGGSILACYNVGRIQTVGLATVKTKRWK